MNMIISQALIDFPDLLNISEPSALQINKFSKFLLFDNKRTIINKGDQVSGAYLVLRGSLRVYSIDKNGKEKTLYDVLPGESCLLAMNSLFSGLLYPAWVECSLNTEVIFIPSAVYKELFKKEESVQQFTFSVLSQRIFNIMSVLDEALSLSIEQRVASYLSRKANTEGKLKVSHQDIASELGTAREVISRILKKMEKSECISLSRGLITIESITSLNHFS